MLIETANGALTPIQFAILIAFIVYISNTALLLTSIGIRLGYHPIRSKVVAFVWPLLLLNRVNEWAKYDPENPPKCCRGYIQMVDERVSKDA